MKKIIKCQKCGETTEVGSNSAKYCKKCSLLIVKEQNRESNKRKKYLIRESLHLTCQICGVDLTAYKKCKKYCPNCRPEIENKRGKAYYQQHREKALAYAKQAYQKPEVKERHRLCVRKIYQRSKRKDK